MKKQVRQLEQWFSHHARQLPWRATHDPYSIWISEVMLQQTQVTTVIPYFEKFILRFPTLQALADAKESEVFALWSGLGYYSRARNLRKGAQFILDHYSGVFPKDRERLLAVPGIGPYTAGAVLSIAFDLPLPIVDGNVARVFARYYALKKRIPELQDRLWKEADLWVKFAQSPRNLNQALMELGATICIKGTPRCHACPIQISCRAYALNLQTKLPKPKIKKPKVELHWVALVIEKKGHFLLKQNRENEWWRGLWDYPKETANSPNDCLKIETALRKKKAVTALKHFTTKHHTVTHHKLHIRGLHLKVTQWNEAGKWFSPEEISELPVSSLFKKLWREMPPRDKHIH